MTRGGSGRYCRLGTIGFIVLVLFLLAAVAIRVPSFGLRALTTTNGGSFAPKVTSIPTPLIR